MIDGFGDKCCGCTACEKICGKNAITMVENAKGFLEANIDKTKCIECDLCDNVCPYISMNSMQTDSQLLFAVKCRDDKKRIQSQSGAAFTVIAEEILNMGGIVYGVALNKKLDAVYIRAYSKKMLNKLKGSKYVQSELNDTFSNVLNDLEKGKWVLFSGTPCHVHGLKNFLTAKRVSTDKLITVDLICHGVPSRKVYREYISLVERRHKKEITEFNFRDKSFGWHGHVSSFNIGRKKYVNNDFTKFFYSHVGLRDCCYTCQYSNMNRVGDITIGDCWGIEKILPDFDDNKGISLIMINNNNGIKIWERISNDFDIIKVNSLQIMQPNLQHPTECPSNMYDFWSDYRKYGCEYALRRYCGCDPSQEYRVVKKNKIYDIEIRVLRKIYHKFIHN